MARPRLSPALLANLFAWGVIFALIAAAIRITQLLGFAGLALLGLATCVVCLCAELDQDAPTWGVEVFRARMSAASSPEQQAAVREERRRSLSPFRFYRRCGAVLAVIGAAGFAWQQWVGA